MNGIEFRKVHGDPAKWSDREYEQFEECATPGDPAPARELIARLNATPKQTDHAPAA